MEAVIAAVCPACLEYEANFDSQPLFDYTMEHTEVPIFAVALYLTMIFYLPQHLNEPWPIRRAWGLWNLLLSIFSIIGASRCVPKLYSHLVADDGGFIFTVCGGSTDGTRGSDWYTSGGPGLWVGLFIYSKMPELLDTAFLTFQKKPVIFLHWFHHVTVLLYCWHAYHHQVSSGLWFASMNYCVHSIMYFYYFIMIFPSPRSVRRAAQKIAPMITTIQILQMVGGIVVTVTGAYETVYHPDRCAINASNYKLGLAMYGSYFALFVALFIDKFVKPKKDSSAAVSSSTKGKEAGGTGEFCNSAVSNDAAGFFHGKLRRRSNSFTDSYSPRDPAEDDSGSPVVRNGRSPSPVATRTRRSAKKDR